MTENPLLVLASVPAASPASDTPHSLRSYSSIIVESLEIILLLRWQQSDKPCPSVTRRWPKAPSLGCSPPSSPARHTAVRMEAASPSSGDHGWSQQSTCPLQTPQLPGKPHSPGVLPQGRCLRSEPLTWWHGTAWTRLCQETSELKPSSGTSGKPEIRQF